MPEQPTEATMTLEITDNLVTLRFLLQEVISVLKGPDGRCKSAEHTLAMRKLQEARFYLGEAMGAADDA